MSDLNAAIRYLYNEKRRIYSNRQIPLDELQLLVFSTYCCANLTEGKASEMLCVDRITFRDMFAKWLDEDPYMRKLNELVTGEKYDCN